MSYVRRPAMIAPGVSNVSSRSSVLGLDVLCHRLCRLGAVPVKNRLCSRLAPRSPSPCPGDVRNRAQPRVAKRAEQAPGTALAYEVTFGVFLRFSGEHGIRTMGQLAEPV